MFKAFKVYRDDDGFSFFKELIKAFKKRETGLFTNKITFIFQVYDFA